MLQALAGGGRRALRRVIDRLALSPPDGARGRGRANSHVTVLLALNRYGLLTETGLHRYLCFLFSSLRMREFEEAVGSEALGCADVRLYHRHRLAFFRGRNAETAEGVLDLYQRTRGHSCLDGLAADLAAEHFVRAGDAEGLASFIGEASSSEVRAIESPTMLGCARLLKRAGNEALLEKTLATYVDGKSDERKLYFLEYLDGGQDGGEISRRLAEKDWRDVLARFEQAYSAPTPRDGQEFRSTILAPLAAIPGGERDLMNIRFDSAQRGRLMDMIAGRLRRAEPFSLIRLCDGESYAFEAPKLAGVAPRQFEQDALTRELYWWGREVPAEERAPLKAAIREAARAADVVGVPSVYRIIRDRGRAGSRFGENSMQRGCAVVLSNLERGLAGPQASYTEERCGHVLFTRETLEALASTARHLLIVGCWTADELAISGCAEREHIVVPGQVRLARSRDRESQPLFEIYKQVEADVAARCGPGTLALVGAGVIGKIFVARAREQGAVALDVGSILDYLAGYKSRSVVDNA